MKKVLIALGDEELIIRQVKELTSFSIRNDLDKNQIEYWIISEKEIDFKKIEFPEWIKNIVYCNTNDFIIAENFLEALKGIFSIKKPEILIFGSDSFSVGISTRFSNFIKGGALNFVKKMEINVEGVYLTKQAYSTNLLSKFKLKKRNNCLSIEKGFKEEYEILKNKIPIEKIEKAKTNYSWLKDYQVEKIETTDNIEEQKFVIILGKGIGSLENISLIKEFAKKFKGKIGATRPVVMNGWIPINDLVGVSGHFISPEICLVLGASGQGAFSSGIVNSKKIIAVNTDKNAPIFKQSDIGITLDYKVFLREILEKTI